METETRCGRGLLDIDRKQSVGDRRLQSGLDKGTFFLFLIYLITAITIHITGAGLKQYTS